MPQERAAYLLISFGRITVSRTDLSEDDMSRARWFIAVLVVRSRVGSQTDEQPLLDLQFRLIHADDSEAAYTRALELGAQSGQSYRNAEGHEVRWEFMGLNDLREVDDQHLQDGTEVYSQLARDDADKAVVPKGKLSVFWAEANKGRTAEDLLENE
jgi:hypothetical protein